LRTRRLELEAGPAPASLVRLLLPTPGVLTSRRTRSSTTSLLLLRSRSPSRSTLLAPSGQRGLLRWQPSGSGRLWRTSQNQTTWMWTCCSMRRSAVAAAAVSRRRRRRRPPPPPLRGGRRQQDGDVDAAPPASRAGSCCLPLPARRIRARAPPTTLAAALSSAVSQGVWGLGLGRLGGGCLRRVLGLFSFRANF